MIEGLSDKTKQFFFVLIKLSVVFSTFYFIYNKLTANADLNFSQFVQILTKNDVFHPKTMFFLLILSIINWFLEILKWKNLVKTIQPISFYNAMNQTLASLAASIFTPNRFGDYLAKSIYYDTSQRKEILLLNLLNNLAQMLMTMSFGAIGLVLFFLIYRPNISHSGIAWLALLFLLMSVLMAWLFKNKKVAIGGFSVHHFVEFVKSIPLNTHIKNLVFSLLKYLVFSFQFYYILLIFGSNLSYLNSMIAISSMYVLSSILPSVLIFDVAIKAGIAIFIFSFLDLNELVVLSTVLLMWILNFALPSLTGVSFVLKFKRHFHSNLKLKFKNI